MKTTLACVVSAVMLLATQSALAVNVIKLDTASMAATTTDWSAAPTTTDIGEFNSTCSLANMAALTLGGANLTLGGLQFDNNMTGPAAILSGNALTLGTSGINMVSANQNVTISCTVAPGNGLAQTWNVAAGRTLTLGSPISVGSSTGTIKMTLNNGYTGTINLNGWTENYGSDGDYLICSGGTISLGAVNMGRTRSYGTAPTATSPIAASSSDGLIVNGADVSATTVTIGTGSRANSSSSMLLSAGSLTTSGQLVAGKANSGRWNICQVSGGTLNVNDTVNGVIIAQNYSSTVSSAGEFYISGGTANVEKISFGAASDVVGGNGWLIVNGGNLYIGGGGIVLANPSGLYNANFAMISGLLGARADWSTSRPLQLSGSVGTPVVVRAADSAGTAHNITLSGVISGTGSLTKTGNGTLTLGEANTYGGNTTVSSGTLALGSAGAIINTPNLSIAAGATYDVSAISSYALSASTTLKASGTGTTVGSTAATIIGASAGTVDLNSRPISLTWSGASSGTDSTHPPLYVSQGTLNLNGNTITVVVPGTALGAGVYTLITAPTITGSINTTPSYTGGNGVAGGTIGTLSISDNSVILTVTTSGLSATWNTDADGIWTDGTKWSSNPNVPQAAGDAATFGTGTALRTVTLDANKTVGGLTMNNANSFVIANAGKTLTLDNTGAGVPVSVTAGTANAIQTAVSLNDATTVTVSSGAEIAVSGAVSGTGPTRTLTLNGSGTLTLSGANTYTGNTIVNSGILKLGSTSAIGTGTLTINGGNLDSSVAGLVNANNNPQNWNSDFAFLGSQSLDLGTGAVTLSANRQVTVSASSLTVGAVSDGGNNYGIVKAGGGQLTMSGNSTYTGGTIISAGYVKLTSNTGAGSGTIALNNNRLLLGNGVTVANTLSTSSGTTYEFLDVPDAGATATYTGTINSGGQWRIMASGAGSTLVLLNATANYSTSYNYWNAGSIVLAGNTVIADTKSDGHLGMARSSSSVSITLKDNAQLKAASVSMGMGGNYASPSLSLTLNDNSLLDAGIGGGLNLNNSGASTSIGTLTLNGGTLKVPAFTKSSVGADQTAVINFNGATLKATASGAAFLPALSGLTANVQAGGAHIDDSGFAITIAQPLLGTTGDGGLTKVGNGTLTLSGANTYTGNTTIQGGTLLMNGDNSAATGSVGVGSGATLGGTGTIGGAVTVNSGGTLTVGGSAGTPGTLTINNSLALNGSTTLRINKGSTGDLIQAASGAPNLTSGGTLNIYNVGGALAGGDSFTLFSGFTFGGTAPAAGTLPALDAGLNWYLGSIPVDGKLIINQAPTAGAIAMGVGQGDSATLTIIGGKHAPADADGDTLSVSLPASTSGNGASLSTDGAKVTVNYSGVLSFSGPDTFDYTVTDGRGGSVTKTVTVSVSPASSGANIVSTSLVVNDGVATMKAFGIPGYWYRLQYSTDLTQFSGWTDVTDGNVQALGNGSLTLTDSGASGPMRFYRCRSADGP